MIPLRTYLPLLGLLLTAGGLAGEAETLTPEQTRQIEIRTCRLWHDRGIADARAEDITGGAGIRVSVDCEPHAEVRGAPLRALGVCELNAGAWTCEDAGEQLDVNIYGEVRKVRIIGVKPGTALDVLEAIKKKTGKGRRFRESVFAGNIEVFGTEDWPGLIVTVENADWLWSLNVTPKCSGDRCRYRIGEYHQSQNWADAQ